MTTERQSHFVHGPRFFMENGTIMFEFVIDHGNVIGPRPATQADYDKHKAAVDDFMEEHNAKMAEAQRIAEGEDQNPVEGDEPEGDGEEDGEGGEGEDAIEGDPGNPNNPRVVKKKGKGKRK